LSQGLRETIADWLLALAAPLLLVSLFLTWSHQFTGAFAARYRPAIQGVPRDPTAWQVYSIADVFLAVVAVALMALALWGGRARRLVVALLLAVALAFTVHAASVPPTNGAVVFDSSATPPGYVANGATSGAGETVALVALILGAAGVALSFTVAL